MGSLNITDSFNRTGPLNNSLVDNFTHSFPTPEMGWLENFDGIWNAWSEEDPLELSNTVFPVNNQVEINFSTSDQIKATLGLPMPVMDPAISESDIFPYPWINRYYNFDMSFDYLTSQNPVDYSGGLKSQGLGLGTGNIAAYFGDILPGFIFSDSIFSLGPDYPTTFNPSITSNKYGLALNTHVTPQIIGAELDGGVVKLKVKVAVVTTLQGAPINTGPFLSYATELGATGWGTAFVPGGISWPGVFGLSDFQVALFSYSTYETTLSNWNSKVFLSGTGKRFTFSMGDNPGIVYWGSNDGEGLDINQSRSGGSLSLSWSHWPSPPVDPAMTNPKRARLWSWYGGIVGTPTNSPPTAGVPTFFDNLNFNWRSAGSGWMWGSF